MASAIYDIPALALALLSPADRQRAKDYAAYSLEWLPLAANAGNAKAQFTVSSDVDFVAVLATGHVTSTAAPPVSVASPQLLIQLSAADRKVFDKDIHWQNIFNTGGAAPYPIPFPLWLSRATTLTGLATDLSTVASNVRLTFHGFILQQYDRTTSRGL